MKLEPIQWSVKGAKGKDVFGELQEGENQKLEHYRIDPIF